MEYTTSTENKVEIIQLAIQQLIESKQAQLPNNDEDHQHLAGLISQLEALKADGVIDPQEPVAEPKEAPSSKPGEAEATGEDKTETCRSNTAAESEEEVVKEIKKLRKQNKTTHWLLSALILLTVAWQLSEVSLLLKLKEGVRHPFRSFGNMVKGMVKRPRPNEDEQPKLPLFELPDLVTNGEQE